MQFRLTFYWLILSFSFLCFPNARIICLCHCVWQKVALLSCHSHTMPSILGEHFALWKDNRFKILFFTYYWSFICTSNKAFILALLLDNYNLLLLLSLLCSNFKYIEISFLRGQDYRCSLLLYCVWTENFEINPTVVPHTSVLLALLWINPRDSLKWVRQVPIGAWGDIGSLGDGITGCLMWVLGSELWPW